MEGRFGRSFRLLGASWQVLKADKELLVLPLVSFVFISIATAAVLGLAWAGGLGREREALTAVDYVYLFILYFVTYFIGIFFNAAVVGAATIRLRGGDPTVGDGLRMAASKTGKIAGWAAISATVGLILRSLEERFGWLGDLIVGLIGVAWSAITFFVVPVILYEPLGVIQSVKRSGSIFKQRWGETFVGQGALGLAMFLLALPVIAVTVLIGMASPVAAAIVGGLLLAGLIAVGSALSGIYNAALYRYATEGQASGAFSPQDLNAAFRPKR
jgi:predicted Na+-dependent transporter